MAAPLDEEASDACPGEAGYALAPGLDATEAAGAADLAGWEGGAFRPTGRGLSVPSDLGGFPSSPSDASTGTATLVPRSAARSSRRALGLSSPDDGGGAAGGRLGGPLNPPSDAGPLADLEVSVPAARARAELLKPV